MEYTYFAVYHSDNDSDWEVFETREDAERQAEEWTVEENFMDLFRGSKFLEIYVCQVPSQLIPDDEDRTYDDNDWTLWDYDQETLESFGTVTVWANWVNAGNIGATFTLDGR